MRHVIISISNSVHAITRRAAVLAVCLMFLTVMLQIIARYVFSAPPIWTEDVARYAMVWTGLLGATLSFKTRSDAVLMQSVFPKPSQILSALGEAIQSAAVLIFILPVVYFCWRPAHAARRPAWWFCQRLPRQTVGADRRHAWHTDGLDFGVGAFGDDHHPAASHGKMGRRYCR